MRIGSGRVGRALFAILVMVGLSFAPASARPLNSGIWKVMREKDPTASFDDEEDKASPIGDMIVGARHYRLMHYEHNQSERHMLPGGAPHGATRLLVFEVLNKKLIYLGGYTYYPEFSSPDARPHIEGNAVVFPYDKAFIARDNLNDRIVFDEKGPPAEVVLGGENCTFF